MVYKDGLRSEDFFEKFIKRNLPNAKIERVHKPFDFIVNGKYVEIKSTKLYVKQSNKSNNFAHGKYECWSLKQLRKLKKRNIWMCFIIQNDNDFIIQGFNKSFEIPNKRKMSISAIQHSGLKTKKQFLAYIKEK